MFCCLIWPSGVAFTIHESMALISNTNGDRIDRDGKLKCYFHFIDASRQNLIVHFVRSAYECVHIVWRMYVGCWGSQ